MGQIASRGSINKRLRNLIFWLFNIPLDITFLATRTRTIAPCVVHDRRLKKNSD